MPIKQRVLPPRKLQTSKIARQSGRVSRNLVRVEAQGTTRDFDTIVDKGDTRQVTDPFAGFYENATPTSNKVAIQPTYDFGLLAKLTQQSNTLRQCIESYVVNIESYGYALEYVGEEGKETRKEVQAEKMRLETFLSAVNPDESLRSIREKRRWDLESTGNAALEVIRNRSSEVAEIAHMPILSVRRTARDTEFTDVKVLARDPDNPENIVEKIMRRRFCRFVQKSGSGVKEVYFKEYGDPRKIRSDNGEVDPACPENLLATEVLFTSLYTPGYMYGLPRWIGLIPCILGSRESEMVNLNFFRENAIPAMAVLVSGGALTEESFRTIEEYILGLKGQKSMNRILIIEAATDDSSGSVDHAPSAPKIDMKPMISERQQDGLFQDYDQKNQQKIRSAFRLPPIYTGRAEDYTRASAYASMLTAENQIFGPERLSFDEFMNHHILRTYKPKFWRFKSLGPPLTEPETLSKMLKTLEESGGITPNVAIKLASRMLGVDIKPVTEEWGDFPYTILVEYIRQGREIKGLNSFLEEMEVTAAAPIKPTPGGARTAATIKKIQGELSEIAETIREAHIMGVQAPISE